MKKWLKRIGLVVLGLALLGGTIVAYAYFIEPRRLVIVEEHLTVPNLDPKLDGLRIVAIADIHTGSNHVPPDRLRLVVEKANEQNADIILLLGDYVSETGRRRTAQEKRDSGDGTELRIPVDIIADNLQGFSAKYGTYAIIGNHDWWHNEKKISAEFDRVGIRVLNNEIANIQVGESTVRLWGIEDLWQNRRVPAEVFENLADKMNVIAMTHNPDSLLTAPAGFAVMFAGHSHGGQINFPIFGPFSPFNDPRFMDGHAEVDGKHVYVTSGIGTSVLPFRWRVPPEIAVVTLNAAE